MARVYQNHSLWEGFPQYRLFDLLPISILLINLTTIPNQCNDKRFANVVGIAPFKPHLLAIPLENACEVVLMKVRRNKFSFKDNSYAKDSFSCKDHIIFVLFHFF